MPGVHRELLEAKRCRVWIGFLPIQESLESAPKIFVAGNTMRRLRKEIEIRSETYRTFLSPRRMEKKLNLAKRRLNPCLDTVIVENLLTQVVTFP